MDLNAASALLERHYSTIGIDDVFLNAVGPSISPLQNEENYKTDASSSSDENENNHRHQWWLPSVYLVQQFRWKDHPVLLWEMLGDIKTRPEDFVVREISADNQVADLSLHSEFVNHSDEDPSTKKSEAIQKCVQKKTSSSESKHSTPKNKNTEMKTVAYNHPCEAHSMTSPSESDPLQYLKQILRDKLEDKTTVEHVLNELYDLNERVLLTLSTDVTKETIEDVRFVLQQQSAQNSTTAQQLAKQERAEIHEAIRFAYPILKSEIVQDDETLTFHIRVFPEQYFSNIATYLLHPNEDLPLLYAYYKLGYEFAEQQRQQKQQFKTAENDQDKLVGKRSKRKRGGQLTQLDGVILRLRPNLPKAERRNIHQIIEAKTKGMLGTQTIHNHNISNISNNGNNNNGVDSNDVSILVQWTKVARRKVTKKRKRDPSSEHTTKQNQTHTLCVVRKREVEHLTMIQIFSSNLRCRPNEIGFAGIKDMHAITYQFCTFEKVGFQRIIAAQDRLNQRGFTIQPLRMAKRSLRKGDLAGNRFHIVVRNMRQVQIQCTRSEGIYESFIPANASHIHDMADRLRSCGFVNFYGEQRVGDPGSEEIVGVRAMDIGRAILQRDYSKAIDYILTGRRMYVDLDEKSDDFRRFRQTWITTKDPEAALKALPNGGLPRERAVLRGLKRYGSDNPRSVLQCLQHNDRVFYVNAVSVAPLNKSVFPHHSQAILFSYLLTVPIVSVEHNGIKTIARIWYSSCTRRFSFRRRKCRHHDCGTKSLIKISTTRCGASDSWVFSRISDKQCWEVLPGIYVK
jgi:TruD family tRNA pseudouridine synthase